MAWPAQKLQAGASGPMSHAGRMRIPGVPRYGPGAQFYDILSLECPVYRVGRSRAIELMELKPGDRVLDIGCGTGLNFPLLRDKVGPQGHVVGVDASAAMLAQARKRARSWENVTLLEVDAGNMRPQIGSWTFDAMIVTYALSIISDWTSAWDQAMAQLRPGARVAVVDLALPTGIGRLFEPAARLACFTGGVTLHREPWSLVENQLSRVCLERHCLGHVVVAVGTFDENPDDQGALE